MKNLFQIGAGKIGRSFIAQVFSKAGYSIVFADIDPCIVNSLNEAGCYKVISKSNKRTEPYTVRNVSALEINSTKAIIQAIVDADLIAISVGIKSMINLAGVLAKGIKARYSQKQDSPIDIILAENVRNVAELLSEKISSFIPDFPLNEYVGFVETSIGKMVPLMTAEQMDEDLLAVYSEPYNNLIVDKNAFRSPIPNIQNLSPKKNMKAWVDRKFFIHNLGHAALVYQGNYHFPDLVYIWQALEIDDIQNVTKKTMHQAAAILLKIHPEEFSPHQLTDHIDDLIYRFANKSLGDTIYRVGSDLPRKLGPDDRFIVTILKGIELGMDFQLILEAWVKGCYFNAKNEKGKTLKLDASFKMKHKGDPLNILRDHCNLDEDQNKLLFGEISG